MNQYHGPDSGCRYRGMSEKYCDEVHRGWCYRIVKTRPVNWWKRLVRLAWFWHVQGEGINE